MAMKFTPDQQRVIDLRKCNILVSAAAGSGKTAVLVERIAELAGDPKNGTDIDKLLVVTFTNAAAAQMRERLEKALSEKAEQDPKNGHLQRQLTLIHNAQITTIDSFCLYLIRNHFNDIGLDPDFKTADEGEMKLLSQDVLAQLLEEKFAEKDPEFLHCVECFVPGGRESRLEELILQLHEFSMSYPWPKKWLVSHRADYDISSVEELKKTEWFSDLKETVIAVLAECRGQLKQTLKLCEQPDGPYMYTAALEADLELVEQLEAAVGQKQADWAELLYTRLQGLSFVKLGIKKDPCVCIRKREQAKKERERVKTMLTGLKEKYFYTSPKKWKEEMQKAAPALRSLVDLVLLFQEKLEEKKREKNLLDFSDMEHMALQILLTFDEEGNPVPSKTALEYREQFREILIDEYQDSNLVQEFLLRSISGEDDGKFNRFMVGDVKQSIYKFRLARPELFMEKFDSYQRGDGDCVRVDLKQNFRSRREVTDCVNDIFLQVMHKELGGVEYDSDAALYPAAGFPQPCRPGEELLQEASEASPYEPEFLVAMEDGAESGRELEARMIADRIRRLVGTLRVRDKETEEMRPASYKDIVILLRTTSGWDEVFKKILEEAQIPVHITSKTGYFAASEVQNVLNFLRVLNNPLQDIPLFGVLHSCIGDFSDEEIAALRTMDETGKRKLYDCMKLAAQKEEDVLGGKCQAFLDFVHRFREYAVYLPIHDLIGSFLEETGYLYIVSALPGGGQRRANLEMLLARAESFEKTSYSGLFHFIRYIEQMEKYDVDYGESGTMDENADVVRIMSIHKSKGLEFPVCFVSGLSKRFNRQDTAQPVIMDMDLGLALDCVDPAVRAKRTTLKKNVLARKLLRDSMGEELRVLYVAMTRAEEKLILTASCKAGKAPQQAETQLGAGRSVLEKSAQALPSGSGFPAVSAVRLMEASCFYDILLPAWQAAGRQVHCAGPEDFVTQELTQIAVQGNLRQRLEFSDPKEFLDTDDCRALLKRIQSRYAHENLAELFVKTTVSELKKAGMQETEESSAQLFKEEEIIPYLPRFVRKEEEIVTGTMRGSAYHRLLELFPLEKKEKTMSWTAEEIRDIIAEKRESQELTEEYAVVINPHKIAAFLRSGLAQRMRQALAADTLRREQPFVLGISASQLKPSLPVEETVLIQGIIDVFFEENGALVVADYKTDAVKEAKELVRRYQVQLDYYAQALQRLTGKKVKEKIIYSFALEQEILL